LKKILTETTTQTIHEIKFQNKRFKTTKYLKNMENIKRDDVETSSTSGVEVYGDEVYGDEVYGDEVHFEHINNNIRGLFQLIFTTTNPCIVEVIESICNNANALNALNNPHLQDAHLNGLKRVSDEFRQQIINCEFNNEDEKNINECLHAINKNYDECLNAINDNDFELGEAINKDELVYKTFDEISYEDENMTNLFEEKDEEYTRVASHPIDFNGEKIILMENKLMSKARENDEKTTEEEVEKTVEAIDEKTTEETGDVDLFGEEDEMKPIEHTSQTPKQKTFTSLFLVSSSVFESLNNTKILKTKTPYVKKTKNNVVNDNDTDEQILVKCCGVPYENRTQKMKEACHRMKTYYMEELKNMSNKKRSGSGKFTEKDNTDAMKLVDDFKKFKPIFGKFTPKQNNYIEDNIQELDDERRKFLDKSKLLHDFLKELSTAITNKKKNGCSYVLYTKHIKDFSERIAFMKANHEKIKSNQFIIKNAKTINEEIIDQYDKNIIKEMDYSLFPTN
jgi:hypothetical protein